MLNKLYSLSIKTKLTLTIFCIMALFSSGVVLIIKHSFSQNVHTLASKTVKDLIKVNESFIIKSLLEDDVWSIYKFLDSLTRINLIKSAGFANEKNRIVAHTNTHDYPIDSAIYIEKKETLILVPLQSDSLVLGRFIIEIQTSSLQSLFNDLKSHLAISIFFATLLSFVIAYFVSNRILKRLNILSHNATKIQEKKWDEIKPIISKEQDEITLFQNSMELILTKLHQAIENEHHLRIFYHDILESLDESIVLCNSDFNIIYDNQHALNKHILTNSVFHHTILKQLQNQLNHNEHNFMVEFETNEGKTLYLFAIIKPLKEGYAMSFSDITLLKRLQEKQCFTNSFEIVGEISSSVVHEIKNYLQPAKLLIEQEEIDKQDKKRVVNIIHKIDILVNEFLKTGRPIDKLLAIELNIAHEFKTILHLLEAQIKAKKLIIETDINEELTLFIAEKDLETILVNLLENAIDESCEASKIIIHVFKNQQDIIIEITDFGKGIDKTVLKDIYKPFFTTKGEKGSGIGLYTTYKIVYMYQGHIDVQSTHEKTTFSISLPQQLKDKQ